MKKKQTNKPEETLLSLSGYLHIALIVIAVSLDQLEQKWL